LNINHLAIRLARIRESNKKSSNSYLPNYYSSRAVYLNNHLRITLSKQWGGTSVMYIVHGERFRVDIPEISGNIVINVLYC